MFGTRLRTCVYLLVALGAGTARADDPCGAFTWDVQHERALFAAQPLPLAAGKVQGSAPVVLTGRLYELTLSPQGEIAFAPPPHAKKGDGAAYGGLATLTVAMAGLYRVSLDAPVWVDVIGQGTLIQPRDFQGRHGCSAPHKLVEFELPAGTPLTLQFSASAAAAVKVSVTPAPVKAP
jgi:hypothetical protein